MRERLVQQHRHAVAGVQVQMAVHDPDAGVVGLDSHHDVAARGHDDGVFADGACQLHAGHVATQPGGVGPGGVVAEALGAVGVTAAVDVLVFVDEFPRGVVVPGEIVVLLTTTQRHSPQQCLKTLRLILSRLVLIKNMIQSAR